MPWLKTRPKPLCPCCRQPYVDYACENHSTGISVETLGESEQGDENDEEVGATVHSSLVELTEEIPGSSSVLEASSGE